MSSDDKLKPLTFKVPKFMYDKMEEMIEAGAYESRADLIREAIQRLIEWEMKIDSVSQFGFDS